MDSIRIISLELNNYRQYYGQQTVTFASGTQRFTTLLGKNGEGKSNLLNSISWCFYKTEPHGKKSLNKGSPIFNLKYIKEDVKEGQHGKLSVKVTLEKGSKIYHITRTLTVLKGELQYVDVGSDKQMRVTTFGDPIPSGCEVLTEKSKLIISEKTDNNSDFTVNDKIDPDTLIGQILPKDLSVYYLLDGEFLQGFWDDPKKLAQGLEQISQLYLLHKTIKCIDDSNTIPRGGDRNTENISNRINELQHYEHSQDSKGIVQYSDELRWNNDPEIETYYHMSGTIRVEELEEDILKMKNRVKTITDQIRSSGGEKELIIEYNDVQNKYNIANEKKKESEEVYNKQLITKGPYIGLKPAIEKSIKIISKHQEKGELPNEMKQIIANNVLEQGKCICNTNLLSNIVNNNETNQSRINVKNFRDKISKDIDLDIAVTMKSRLDMIYKTFDIFLQNEIEKYRTAYIQNDTEYDNLNKKLKGLKTRLGQADQPKISKLIREQDHLLEKIEELIILVADEKNQLNKYKEEIKKLKQELSRFTKKNDKLRKITARNQVWDNLTNYLITIYNELKEEIRNSVQNKTWEIFTKLLDNSSEFTKLIIKPDYDVVLLDQYGSNKIINLSAGQSLILTLAFIASLREPTGYKFPLIIDSPLGKIDGPIRYNIGEIIPNYLPNDQIVFLVTDTEYTAKIPLDADSDPNKIPIPFGKVLEEKTEIKHFRIKKDNFGNSEIYSASLQLNNNNGEWEVN